jgi:hypothetical protein
MSSVPFDVTGSQQPLSAEYAVMTGMPPGEAPAESLGIGDTPASWPAATPTDLRPWPTQGPQPPQRMSVASRKSLHGNAAGSHGGQRSLTAGMSSYEQIRLPRQHRPAAVLNRGRRALPLPPNHKITNRKRKNDAQTREF